MWSRLWLESTQREQTSAKADLSAFIPHCDFLVIIPKQNTPVQRQHLILLQKLRDALTVWKKAETLIGLQSDQLQNVISCKSPQLVPRIFMKIHPGSMTFTASCWQHKRRQKYASSLVEVIICATCHYYCVTTLLCLLSGGQNRCNILLPFTKVYLDFPGVPLLSTVAQPVALFTIYIAVCV